jgi:hypothetical protein
MAMLEVSAAQAVMPGASGFGLAQVQMHGFRSARDVAFAPGSLCALVGEANAGSVLAESAPDKDGAAHALELSRRALAKQVGGEGAPATAPARSLAQRYLHRLRRVFAAAGNQVICSTQSPGHRHKSERTGRRFASLSAAELPVPLVRAAELALTLARPR